MSPRGGGGMSASDCMAASGEEYIHLVYIDRLCNDSVSIRQAESRPFKRYSETRKGMRCKSRSKSGFADHA